MTPPLIDEKNINGDQEGCRLDLKPSPIEIENSAGKGMSGMDKFGSVIDRMNMKLGSKFLNLYIYI